MASEYYDGVFSAWDLSMSDPYVTRQFRRSGSDNDISPAHPETFAAFSPMSCALSAWTIRPSLAPSLSALWIILICVCKFQDGI
jgi:hypothetical protein